MPTIVPFTDEHLDAAGRLLAERHRTHRGVEPGLDKRYEDPAAAGGEVEALKGREGASGVAARAGGDVVGFLIGTTRDASWGPNVWVEPAGHAASNPEVVRDLYAAAAEGWVADGRTFHYAMVPATDPTLVDAWFRLGFGHQHVHAIRETPAAPSAQPPCCALEVSASYTSLALAPDAGFLGFAAVLPEARGSGAGRLLGEAVIDWARETGRPTVVADWRMTNLLASRAWQRLGFRPMFYCLFRAIPPA
jgi:GNAT superfamily N-acetyltransferase